MLTFIKFNFPEIKCYRNFSFSLTSIKLHLTLKSNQNSPKLLQWREKILKLRYNWFQFQNLPPSSQRSGWGWSAVCCPQSEYFSKEANFPAAINHILTRWSSNKNNTGLPSLHHLLIITSPSHTRGHLGNPDNHTIIISSHTSHQHQHQHHESRHGDEADTDLDIGTTRTTRVFKKTKKVNEFLSF